MSTFSTLLQCSLVTAIRQEVKVIHIGKEEVKLSLFSEDIALYIQNTKNSRKKPARTDI